MISSSIIARGYKHHILWKHNNLHNIIMIHDNSPKDVAAHYLVFKIIGVSTAVRYKYQSGDLLDIMRPWQNGRLFADDIFKPFSWKKINEFRLTFLCKLFLSEKFTIFEHCFFCWIGADQLTTHYLISLMVSLLTNICVTRPQWVKLPFKGMEESVYPTKGNRCNYPWKNLSWSVFMRKWIRVWSFSVTCLLKS